MSDRETNYYEKAESDAADMVRYFESDIVKQLLEGGKASDDYNNDYDDGDSYHHQSHVDKAYTLLEAANLLDQLDKYEETDSGLWEGQMPRDAISTQAAFTYGNAVGILWSDFIKKINEAFEELSEKPEGKAVGRGSKVQDWSPTQQKYKKSEAILNKMIHEVLAEGL